VRNTISVVLLIEVRYPTVAQCCILEYVSRRRWYYLCNE